MRTWCERHPNVVLVTFAFMFAADAFMFALQFNDNPDRGPIWWAWQGATLLITGSYVRNWWRRT